MSTLCIKDLVTVKKNTDDLKDKSKYKIILKGLSTVQFESGKLNAIMGPNGCGKTTMLKTIYGIMDGETKTSGSILLDGEVRTPAEWFSKISMIEQRPYLPAKKTVRDVIQLALDLHNSKFNRNTKMEDIEDIAACLCLEGVLNTRITALSGGEHKRVAILYNIIFDKEILILDEPTSDLDSHLALNLIVFLKKFAVERSKMIIFTIHQPSDQIVKQFDNLLFMASFGAIYSGPMAQLDQFLSSNGIVRPEDWTMSDFLFEAFYNKSTFKAVSSQSTEIQALIDSTNAHAESVFVSSSPSDKSKKYISRDTTFKEVCMHSKRLFWEITGTFTFCSSFIVYLCLLVLPVIVKRFVLGKQATVMQAIGMLVKHLPKIVVEKYYKEIKTELNNNSDVLNLFGYINDLTAVSGQVMSISLMLTGIAIVTGIAMKGVLPIIMKEIYLSYYKPITISISLLVINFVVQAGMTVLTIICWLAIGGLEYFDHYDIFWIIGAAFILPVMSMFLFTLPLLITKRHEILETIQWVLFSTSIALQQSSDGLIAVASKQNEPVRCLLLLVGVLFEMFAPTQWCVKYFKKHEINARIATVTSGYSSLKISDASLVKKGLDALMDDAILTATNGTEFALGTLTYGWVNPVVAAIIVTLVGAWVSTVLFVRTLSLRVSLQP